MPAEIQETTIKQTTESETAHDTSENNTKSNENWLAHLVLEDFVVTNLLRVGRGLKNSDLQSAAEGFTLSRDVLRDGLHDSKRVALHGREWDLKLRLEAAARPRDERTRRPLENTLDELLSTVGKPLPVPVIVRELANMRSVLPETIRDTVGYVLKSTRTAIEVAPNSYLSTSFTLDASPPREDILIRESKLEADPAFALLRERDFSGLIGSLADKVTLVLQAANQPISQKLLGYLLWKHDPRNFDAQQLAATLGDRKQFYSFAGGLVTTQGQLPRWKAALQNYVADLGHAAVQALDVNTLLRQRLTPEQIIVPRAEDMEEIRKAARTALHPISIVNALIDTLEMEPDDPSFVPTLQGLNDALRRSPEFLPAGVGRFLLRETVPDYVGATPESLRPVHLSIRSTESDEPLDVEMSDEGLEGDAPDFVHAPQWEDVSEEVEVKLPRRTGAETYDSLDYTVLYHHYQAGTLKLRRQDEDFFMLQAALARIPITATHTDGEETTTDKISAWISRESGLIYGLGEWYESRIPQSGGVLHFSRGVGGNIDLTVGAPDKLTYLDEERVAELESLQERSAYLSLYDLLQSVMLEHTQGAELPTIWAEVNAVRRTSKRLVCSVLSAYHCFYFKQRGPKQILWRFDEGKMDQGFKRNKRKFVRR